LESLRNFNADSYLERSASCGPGILRIDLTP
jgi:hypothetical protein